MSYPQQQQPYYPPQKKRRTWLWVLVGVLVLFVLGFAGCAAMLGAAGKAMEEATAPRTLVYDVEGTARASISYWQTGGMGSESSVKLPWRKEVQSDGFAWGTLTVTTDQNGGEVLCRVSGPDGKVIAENRASGPFAMASCNGTAPH